MGMTETKRLREMLDERGVKWWEGYHTKATCFDGAFGVRYVVDGTLGELFIRSMLNVTPEQAIEATLGRGECRNVDKVGLFKCSECGHFFMGKMVFRDGSHADPRYCPNCGRKVVDE